MGRTIMARSKEDKLVKKVLDKLEGKDEAQRTYYVSSNGSDNNDGLSPGKPLKTISRAMKKPHKGRVFIMGPSGLSPVKIEVLRNA